MNIRIDLEWKIITFGKYKGRHFRDLPLYYMKWLYNNKIAKGNLKNFIEKQLCIYKPLY